MRRMSAASKTIPRDLGSGAMEGVPEVQRHQISIITARAQQAKRLFVRDNARNDFQLPGASCCVSVTRSSATNGREKSPCDHPPARVERGSRARSTWDRALNAPSNNRRDGRPAALMSSLFARPTFHRDHSEEEETRMPCRTKVDNGRVDEEDMRIPDPEVRIDQPKTLTLFLLTQPKIQIDESGRQNVPSSIPAGHDAETKTLNDATRARLTNQTDEVTAVHDVENWAPSTELEAVVFQCDSRYNKSAVVEEEQPLPLRSEDGLLSPWQKTSHTSPAEPTVPSENSSPGLQVQIDDLPSKFSVPAVVRGDTGQRPTQRIAIKNALGEVQSEAGHFVGDPQRLGCSYAEDCVSDIWCGEDGPNQVGGLRCLNPVHSDTRRVSVNPSICRLRHRSYLHHSLQRCVLRHHSVCSGPACGAARARLDILVKLLLLFLLASPACAVDLSVQVVVVERCDSELLETNVTQALSKASSFLANEGVAPDVKFIFTRRRYCQQREALEKVKEIFNGAEHLVIGIAPYELQTTFTKMARLFQKPYISANFYTPQEDVNELAVSLMPTYRQTANVLGEVLASLQWQEVLVIASDDSYWQAVAAEVHVQLAGEGFTFKEMKTVPVGVSATGAEEAVKGVQESSKAVILAMEDSDVFTVLGAASDYDMATRHGFFLIVNNPYGSGILWTLYESLQFEPNMTDILDSVFVLTMTFMDSSPASSRRRRSVGNDDVIFRSVSSMADFSAIFSDAREGATAGVSLESTQRTPGAERGRGWLHTAAQASSTASENADVFSSRLENKSFPKERPSANADLIFFPRAIKFTRRARRMRPIASVRRFETSLRGDAELAVQTEQRQRGGWERAEDATSDTERASAVTASSHSIHKRSITAYNATDPVALSATSDLAALHDVVLAVGYMLNNLSSSSSISIPAPAALLSLVDRLDFQGELGRIVVGEQRQKRFDAVLYDFDGSAGFVERMYFASSSPNRWTVSETGSIVWPKGQVLEADTCFMQSKCPEEGFDIVYVVIIFASVAGITIIITIIVFFIKRYWAKKEMTRGPNKVILCPEDLVFMLKKDIGKGSKLMKSRMNLIDQSRPDLLKGSDPNRSTGSINELSDFTQTARYNGDLVHVKELKVKNVEIKSKIYAFVRMLRDLRHENINPYVGFLVDPERPAMVMEYCSRGSLKDMLHNEDIKLDWDFKLSLLTDLVRGLRYLHNTPLKIHGHLTSRNCVIDSRFVLKITDYGIPGFLEKLKTTRELEPRDLLWTAPELLRDELLLPRGTEKGDVYSLSIIFQEVALRSEPYSSHNLTPEEILKKVRKPPPLCRPSVSPQAAPPHFIQTMKQCWSEMPDMRPTVEEVYEQFKKLSGGKKANIVDTMFKMLEKYSNDLEDIVAERTEQLEEEKKKTDQLLFRMLPSTVAESLKMGRNVQAETFSEVTIYFSDIVGFTTISALSTPMQVVGLLNDLYTMFDATIERYDVYKVETIGDAYMVVSGLPVRNGNRHAGEVSTMALELLSHCGHFTISHMPHVPMRLRIGLHTGSCVAGVVGLTMPRYCLFGDTVNTASRMESTGAAFRIHISQVCKEVLDELGGYVVDYRGETELKGKGIQKTWWLVGKEGFDLELPEPPPIQGLSSLMPEIKPVLEDLMPNMPPGLLAQPNQEKQASADGPHDHSDPGLGGGGEGAPARGGAADVRREDAAQQPRDGGFDSGRGESSDGDSPQSPRLRANRVGASSSAAAATVTAVAAKDVPASAPPGGTLLLPASSEPDSDALGGIPASSPSPSRFTSPATASARSPRKGGHSRQKNATSASERGPGDGGGRGKPCALPNSVITEAEIYPEAWQQQQPSQPTPADQSSGAHAIVVDAYPGVAGAGVGAGVGVGKRGAGTAEEQAPGAERLDALRTEEGRGGEAGEVRVDVTARDSVVSSSDVSIHSTGNGSASDKSRKLTLESRDVENLTPVTEV